MVNSACTSDPIRSSEVIVDPERSLVLRYAPTEAAARGMAALLLLDERLAETVRTTSEPMLGQIRLKWWHDALSALDDAPPPAEPVLQAIADEVVGHGVAGREVAAIAEAWGAVLDAELDDDALTRFARRGSVMFELVGRIAGVRGDPVVAAGAGWALADLACGLSDVAEVARVRAAAGAALDRALAVRWGRNGRALGAMAHLARLDLAGSAVGSPRRVARVLWHRATGR
jgi:phytoene synthase